MKVLKNAKFTGNIKINDTNTDIYFQAYDDGVLQKLNPTQCSFRIKNDTGYLITISNVSTETDYITFKSNELKPLPVGTYYLELWVEDSSGTYIYPDESFCKLRINENVTVAQGTTIPTISLEEYENKLQGYVDNTVADGTQKIESDFDKYVDSITDSTIATATKASQDAATAINTANSANAAAQNATNIANAAKSNADSASQAAVNAQTVAGDASAIANTAKSTADTALSKANTNASSISKNTSNINTNSDSINGGLYLNLAKSFAQVNTSRNLIVNSEFLDKQDNDDPYQNWGYAWGWKCLNSEREALYRRDVDGKAGAQCYFLKSSSPIISTGICAGKRNQNTVVSASIYYRKDPNNTTFNSGQEISIYIEYDKQSSFTNPQKALVGTINENSAVNGYINKENIIIPAHYDWIRMRLESNQSSNAPWIWIAHPMINYGATIQDYVISNAPGQRIAAIESDIADLKSQIQTLQNQLSANN